MILKIKGFEKFDLSQTFECGQCFRWDFKDNVYHGIVDNFDVFVYYKNDDLILEGENLENSSIDFWINYFDLKTNYLSIKNNLKNIDSFLDKAIDFCPGIRILNQKPWETLCSFIISQNNNIPRIKKIIGLLCENFGKKLSKDSFSFPGPEVLKELDISDLSVIKSGFRAKYILDAAKKVCSKEVNLEEIKSLDILSSKNLLMKINGVGPKVATCVLLYGFHRLDAFPVDVWVKRIMDNYFSGKNYDIFGKYAGVAQQYLFHYIRNLEN